MSENEQLIATYKLTEHQLIDIEQKFKNLRTESLKTENTLKKKIEIITFVSFIQNIVRIQLYNYLYSSSFLTSIR